MAKHAFGIMDEPLADERFDDFEPEKYSAVFVDDDLVSPILELVSSVDCYCHTLSCPQKGLNYCGITLIPPASLDKFIEVFDGNSELVELFCLAKSERKFVIHFGI